MNRVVKFMERPGIRKITRWSMLAIMFVLVMIDPFIEKHASFAVEDMPAFYAVYGFFSCAIIVAISKIIGKVWLQKREDYYD